MDGYNRPYNRVIYFNGDCVQGITLIVPWWALSPSPFSLVFWAILSLWTIKKLHERIEYKRLKWLVAFSDSVFIIGLIILIFDVMWVFASGLKWLPLYPDSLMQLVYAQGRNLCGIILCSMLIGEYFKNPKPLLRFTDKTVIVLIVNGIFLWLWFTISPSPAYTDWTFAIKYGYSPQIVLQSFLTSHVIGKALNVLVYYSIWKKP